MEKSKRNPALDITRICALFCVISVHFFLYNGFYNEPAVGWKMYIMTLMRNAFMVCVPMFIMLTGYLMSRKELNRKYYFGIVKTLSIYVLASIACRLYKVIAFKSTVSVGDFMLGLLSFTEAQYSWYIEMYIGLFLLAPFLNILWRGCQSEKKRLAMILTMVALTSLPTILNCYNFESIEWWKTPVISDKYVQLMPEWWVMSYPVTYYFLGAYLHDHPLKLKQWQKSVLLIASAVLFGSFNYYRSYGGDFVWASYNNWHGLPILITTFILFSLLSSVKTEKMSEGCKYILAKVSDLCLGGYLLSYIFDNLFYAELNKNVKVMTDRLPYYFAVVPCIFICSLALSLVINIIYKAIYNLIVFICKQAKGGGVPNGSKPEQLKSAENKEKISR